MKVVVAKAHEGQLQDKEIAAELESIQQKVNENILNPTENVISFVFVKGLYNNSIKKMTIACLFINGMNRSICELHGELKLKFTARNALIAKATVNFDEPFMGILQVGNALLVHFNIPTKGLIADEIFTAKDITGTWDNVRVTYSNEESL